MEKLYAVTPLWREAYFEVKSAKKSQSRVVFWGLDVENLDGVVVRSKFRSQNGSTSALEHSWTLRR